jgi:hypothetical protein
MQQTHATIVVAIPDLRMLNTNFVARDSNRDREPFGFRATNKGIKALKALSSFVDHLLLFVLRSLPYRTTDLMETWANFKRVLAHRDFNREIQAALSP